MRKIKIIMGVGMSLMIMLLSACSSSLPFPAYPGHSNSSDYLEKGMYLSSDMLLAEASHLNLAGNGRYWVFSFAEKRYFNNYINLTMPTESEYKRNPEQWQKWHGNVLDGWARLVGVLIQGTKFHIIDIAPRQERNGYWVTVQFDSGPYQGKTAIYANAKSLIPDMYKR